ncbi:hypothetical protein ACH4ND_33120 [Streptomyces sp. NPDC017179]|uniref:hypothetical protein n=1 Tax=Streptomyces sp. NPDC017179 TaxID=3364979 RepID=UPI0037983735
MSDADVIAEAVDGFLADPRTLRIQCGTALVADLALGGFEGLEYEVFEDRLLRDSMPILRGMLCSGTFITLSAPRFEKRGIPFFVGSENRQLLHSSAAERDGIIVDLLMRARKTFRKKALLEGGWDANFGGSKGACCLMTCFIGRCMWDFRRVFLRWARERRHIAQVEAALLAPEAFFRLLTALPHHGEPETILPHAGRARHGGHPGGCDRLRGRPVGRLVPSRRRGPRGHRLRRDPDHRHRGARSARHGHPIAVRVAPNLRPLPTYTPWWLCSRVSGSGTDLGERSRSVTSVFECSR